MGNMATTSTPERGHLAAVDSREELIYLLSRASEIEHNLACVYLYASYSLKSDLAEGGMTQTELDAVLKWKRKLAGVAVEEMLHLAQVANMHTAIGGAPHFRRSNFPLPASAFPFGIPVSLEPFSQELIERLVCYEMPEDGVLPPEREAQYADIKARNVTRMAQRVEESPLHNVTEPYDIDFKTVGEFYHKIKSGFESLDERELFIGPPEAQAKAKYLDFAGELVQVLDRESACRGIDMIVMQGEAPSTEHPEAHFVVFDSIRTEYEALLSSAKTEGRTFDPVRPLISNPRTHYFSGNDLGCLINDPYAHEVADLFNTVYDTMLQMLLRFFAHIDETEDELRLLARGTLRMMASVIRPLGEALAKMSAGSNFPGKNAGPGFGYNRDIHLLSHKESAWVFFLERLWELATRTSLLAKDGGPVEIAEAAAALEAVAEHLMPFLPEERAQRIKTYACTAAVDPTINPEVNGPYIVAKLTKMTNSKGETLNTRTILALCRCGGSAIKPYCDGTHARIGFNSAKLAERVEDRLDRYEGDGITVRDNRGTCCHFGNCTDKLPSVFHYEGEPFVTARGGTKEQIIDIVNACPSGALGYEVDGEVWQGHSDAEKEIYVSHNGPYYVRGGIELRNTQRNEGANLEHYALCRCGKSKNKPFCDGSHWYAKFDDPEN